LRQRLFAQVPHLPVLEAVVEPVSRLQPFHHQQAEAFAAYEEAAQQAECYTILF
jgi:hypothetical protein